MQTFAPFMAGLGLFFCGVHFLSSNLTPLAGRRFRLVLTQLLTRPWMSAFAGIVAGVVTQSAHAVTYVIIGLVSGGVVDKRRAILIPTWAHVGTSVLVILVALNFAVAASYLIAMTGFAIYFGMDRSDRSRHIVGALLGVGLLFLGLEGMKTGSVSVRDMLIGEGIIASLIGHPFLLFVMGFAATVLCQSSAVVSAITVAAIGMGLLDFEGAVWLVLGANLGSGFNNLLLARSFRGEASQIALIQTLQKLSGFAVVGSIIAAGFVLSRPLLAEGASYVARSPAGQLAGVFVFYQFAGSLVCAMFLPQIIAGLERLFPPSELQEQSRPAFLIDEALIEPTLAIELVGREEQRLLARLPAMLDEIRLDAAPGTMRADEMRAAGIAVTKAIAEYLDQITEASLNRSDRERVVRLQHRGANLGSLFDAISEFVDASRKAQQWASSAKVAAQMIEALHALLTSLVEATLSDDATDREILLSLLGHRDEMMERVRRRVLREDPDMPPRAQDALFATTMLFERIVWLARRNALSLTSDPVEESGQPVAKAAA